MILMGCQDVLHHMMPTDGIVIILTARKNRRKEEYLIHSTKVEICALL